LNSMKEQTIEYVAYRNHVEEINRLVKEDAPAFVEAAETDYRQNVDSIAAEIAAENPACRLVMLAGPSSSGKTTTAHMLKKALVKAGVGCESVSLDDFYRGKDIAPLLPNGKRDYEALEALDVPEIQKCLYELVKNNSCDMPVFDFENHVPFPHRRHVVLKDREVAVVEGIHALNPKLISMLPEYRVHRIYISVKQGVHNDKGSILGPNDVRLVRRLVRDYHSRGTKPETTLSMWPNVMRGEYKYIKPFRKDANTTINSFHDYELNVLAKPALELLSTVSPESPEYPVAVRLKKALLFFEPLSPELVPKSSMIREFIGGGNVD
jgi:uridine kinase